MLLGIGKRGIGVNFRPTMLATPRPIPRRRCERWLKRGGSNLEVPPRFPFSGRFLRLSSILGFLEWLLWAAWGRDNVR